MGGFVLAQVGGAILIMGGNLLGFGLFSGLFVGSC